MKLSHSCLILFISIFVFIKTAYSQSILFGYDAVGNRVKKEILMPSNEKSLKKAPGKSFVSEILSDKTIKIYPNPTKGILKVEIVNYGTLDLGEISLFNFNGIKLFASPISDSFMQFDLSSYDRGIYLMHIAINGNESTWKIKKE